MNITDPHITAKVKAAHLEEEHAGNVATLGFLLVLLALAIFINAI